MKNTTNKKTYLVAKDEFNRKTAQVNMLVNFIGGSLISMLFNYRRCGYILCDYHVGCEYVVLTSHNEEEANAIEAEFEGRWAE